MGYNLNEPFTWREDLLKLSVNVVDIKIVYLAVVYIFIEFYNGLKGPRQPCPMALW